MAKIKYFANKGEIGATPINAENLNTNTQALLEILGLNQDNYSFSKKYEVGDLVIYNNKIYACIEEVTIPEEFDESKWEFVPLFVEGKLNPILFSTMYTMKEKIVGKWIDGKPIYQAVINGTINNDSNLQTIYVNHHVKHLIDYYGYIEDSANNVNWVIGKSIHYTGAEISRIVKVAETLRLDVQTFFHGCTFSAVVKYTKTTD